MSTYKDSPVFSYPHSLMPKSTPANGPRVTFFSGGSALKQTSRVLKQYTHNSLHIVTPFDSGGSSAKIRNAFNMPAIGDLRSRMLALADESVAGSPETYQFLNYRLPDQSSQLGLNHELLQLLNAQHPLAHALPSAKRHILCELLNVFYNAMPDNFDLSGASLGNLVIAGGYLKHHSKMDSIIQEFCQLVKVQGKVNICCDQQMHLVAELSNGDSVVGQHRITGKEYAPLEDAIEDVYISNTEEKPQRSLCRAKPELLEQIKDSELICYAPGSFYSSLIANLLPLGICDSIASINIPKVFVPSLGIDPEIPYASVYERVQTLIKYLQRGASKEADDIKLLSRLLTHVLYDESYSPINAIEIKKLKSMGISLINQPLVKPTSNPEENPHYEPTSLSQALIALAP